MNFIVELQKEHELIERELLEMETIIASETINYANLIHVSKKLTELWDKHEKEEERIFPLLKHEDIIVPVRAMFFEHSQLSPHRHALVNAINSANDSKIKEALDKHAKVIIEKLREHINQEDEVLYRITLGQFTDEEIEEATRIIESAE